MKGLTNKIPVYAFFPERMKEDSADLDYKLSLTDFGVQYLFSDKLYKQYHTNSNTSIWYLLDRNGKVSATGDLKTFDGDTVLSKVDDVVAVLPPCPSCQLDFTENNMYLLDIDLNKIQVWPKQASKATVSLRSRDLDFNTILSKLHGSDSTLFADVGILYNTNGMGFRSGYVWMDIAPNGDLLAMVEYLHPFTKEDSVYLDIRQCVIVHDSNGLQKDVLFMDQDSVLKYNNYASRFVVNEDGSFLTFTHDAHNWFRSQIKKNSVAKIPFITTFSLNKNKGYYTPIGKYDIDLPDVYKKKYFENYLSSELCSYPFVAFRYGNELHDMTTLKRSQIIEDVVYKASVDMNSDVLGEEKYTALALSVVKDNVVVVYRLGKDIYMNYYTTDLELIKTVTVGNPLRGHLTDDCFIDPYAEQVYFTFDGDANSLSLPLHLFN